MDKILRLSSFSSEYWVSEERSNGLMRLVELKEKLIYSPPTASLKALYSFSGSIMITSVPNMRERRASSLTKYDFPAPAFAKTTEFAFSMEKRSKITRLPLCSLRPYMMPSLLVNSDEVKGKVVARDVGFMVLGTNMCSIHTGSVEWRA